MVRALRIAISSISSLLRATCVNTRAYTVNRQGKAVPWNIRPGRVCRADRRSRLPTQTCCPRWRAWRGSPRLAPPASSCTPGQAPVARCSSAVPCFTALRRLLHTIVSTPPSGRERPDSVASSSHERPRERLLRCIGLVSQDQSRRELMFFSANCRSCNATRVRDSPSYVEQSNTRAFFSWTKEMRPLCATTRKLREREMPL